MAELWMVAPGDWASWREVRLRALVDAPQAFTTDIAEWVDADEAGGGASRTSRATCFALIDGGPVGQVSGTGADDAPRVELISLWSAPAARCTGILSVKRHDTHLIARYERAGFTVSADPPAGDEVVLSRPLAARPDRDRLG